MVFKLFRRSFTVDEEYMLLFVHAFQAINAHAAYDYAADLPAIADQMARETPNLRGEAVLDQAMQLLVTRGTPLKTMLAAREQLRRRKPKDRRFSTNLHRRMIRLIDWQERELRSVLLIAGLDPRDTSKQGLRDYARVSRASHGMSERVDRYGRLILQELQYIYERFPQLRPHLAPIFGG